MGLKLTKLYFFDRICVKKKSFEIPRFSIFDFYINFEQLVMQYIFLSLAFLQEGKLNFGIKAKMFIVLTVKKHWHLIFINTLNQAQNIKHKPSSKHFL